MPLNLPFTKPLRNALTAAFWVVLLLICGCSNYEFRLNERLVYDPFPDPDRERNATLADPGFQGCLNSYLNNNEEQELESIKLLACPEADISTLDGISALSGLEQLELSENVITDLSPLADMNNLRVLSVRNNRIRDVRTLQSLPLLRTVSLQGNNDIPCRQLDSLQEKSGSGLSRPQFCKE